MTTDKPITPDDMPLDAYTSSAVFVNNTLQTLQVCSCLDLHWERTGVNSLGELEGRWAVEVTAPSGNRIACEHDRIENALWYANEMLDADMIEDQANLQAERQAVLNKLTPRERELLGVKS
jgi:hypothetical protein